MKWNIIFEIIKLKQILLIIAGIIMLIIGFKIAKKILLVLAILLIIGTIVLSIIF